MTNREKEYVEIIEYYDKSKNIFFNGTIVEFEEFKKRYGIYPYPSPKPIKDNQYLKIISTLTYKNK